MASNERTALCALGDVTSPQAPPLGPGAGDRGWRPRALEVALAIALGLVAGACDSAPPEPARLVPATPAPPPLPFDAEDARLDLVGLAMRDLEGWRPLELIDGAAASPGELALGHPLRVELFQRPADFRAFVVDERGRTVPLRVSGGPVATRPGPTPAPGGHWFRVELVEALEIGAALELRLESQGGGPLQDIAGRSYDDLVLPLRVVPPPEPAAQAEGIPGAGEAQPADLAPPPATPAPAAP